MSMLVLFGYCLLLLHPTLEKVKVHPSTKVKRYCYQHESKINTLTSPLPFISKKPSKTTFCSSIYTNSKGSPSIVRVNMILFEDECVLKIQRYKFKNSKSIPEAKQTLFESN